MKETRFPWQTLLCYGWVYLCWGVWDKFLSDHVWILSAELTNLFELVIIKNLIWLLPAAVCVKMLRMPLRWPLKELLTKKTDYVQMVLAACFVVVVVHSFWLVIGKGIALFNPLFCVWAICAGITEEILFRGIILNAQLKMWKPITAIAANSIMFLFIHYTHLPYSGSIMEIWSLRGLVIAVMGAVFPVVTMKTQSLKMPIFMHTLWNFLVYIYGLN